MVGNPLFTLHQKIKNTCKSLSIWSRKAFGDIYEEPYKLEVFIRSLEDASTTNNCPDNRMNLSRARVEFTRFLKLQDNVLRQKFRVKWLIDGNADIDFFHGVIKNRRKKLMIQNIKYIEGNWVEGNNEIGETALKFFEHLFAAEV